MSISVEDFKTLFPEFDAVDDAIVGAWLEFAECSVCLDRFPDCMQDKAHGFLGAHYLKLAVDRASNASAALAAGPMQSMSVGDVAVSFSPGQWVVDATDFASDLAQTQYGRIFYGMFRRYSFAVYSTGLAK